MLNLTQAAGSHLAEVLGQANASDEASLRLLEEGGSLKLAIDRPTPEDTTLDHEGKTVLVIDTRVAAALDQSTLDVTQTPEGPRFVLK
jgi:Fe-S cluster assembly iron-binding protein IscA